MIPAQSSPLHHPLPREPSERLSRSPKRVRSTPPISDQPHSPSPIYSTGSTRSRTGPGTRPSIGGKRGISYDKDTRQPRTSPWQSRHSLSEWGLSRRREMSVPLLSQTLSTFTLSQSSSTFGLFPTESDGCDTTPPAFDSRPSFTLPVEGTPSTSLTSHTPRRNPGHNLRSSFFGDLPTDHPHPSTAPLPQLPTFLGSPFSSKTARGGYRFRSMSPSKGAMTERIGQEGFENLNLDWLGKTEWMCDEVDSEDTAQEHEESRPAPRPSKLQRDHCSTSSIDDSCDSGTSSSSLTSLGRSSAEQVRPHLVSIWGEADALHLEEDEAEDPATPSRQLFQHSSGHAGVLQMAVKDKALPSMSPLVGKSRSRQRSPLQVFFMQTPGTAHTPLPDNPSPTLPPSTSRSTKSLNSLLPRLVSSRKPAKPGSQAGCARSPQSSQRVRSQASSGPSSAPPSRIPMSRSQKSLFKAPAPSALSEIRPARAAGWAPSVEFGDDGDPESSPSKMPDVLHDSVSSSATDATNDTTSTTDSPIEPARAALVARRKTLAAQPSAKIRSTGTVKPTRPSLRRGITDPKGDTASVFSPEKTFSTPVSALFGDEKPSPAAFASTGLVKKKSGTPGLEIPRFGDSEPPTRIAGLPRGGQPVKSRLGIMIASSPAHRHALANVSNYEDSPVASSTGTGASVAKTDKTDGSSSTDASVSIYVRGVQQTRGLRRKTSSMFVPSTSSGSIDGSGAANSPATPTKGMFSVPGLGITTPSPVAGQQNVYPFASTSTAIQAPGSAVSRRSIAEVSPTEAIPTASLASRLSRTIKRPVARVSNPMLAETFKLDGVSGHAKNPSSGPPSEALKVGGSRLDHDFTLVGNLGKGEFSQVWKVMEKSTGTMYAVKAGRPYTGYKNRLRQLEEVSILRQLSLTPHDHVLTFIDSWEHSNRLFIRTELASCGDFATFLLSIADQGAMDEARLWKALFELSSGLQYIHGNSFVHLDLKPSNILIAHCGALKIADFGMSLLISDGEVGGLSPALPKSGTDGDFLWGQSDARVPVPSPLLDREVEGDREYLCPEALSERTVGTAADMFSLGILLLEAALNVVLPSNGDGWVKLRNDDFSDTLEHYLPRGQGSTYLGPGRPDLPLISEAFMDLIKGLMYCHPTGRRTLSHISGLESVRRMSELRAVAEQSELAGDGGGEGQRARSRSMSPALVEEGGWFLPYILGETE